LYSQLAVLVLEDDPDQLASLCQLIEGCGLRAVRAHDASQALRLLKQVPPVLAIVDRDLSQAADREHTSLDVLAALDRHHPTCTAFVFSNAVSSLAQQAQVWAAHKSAILHEKRFGTDTLLRRVRQFVTPVVGDLQMRDGAVCHRRTSARVTHWVACALLMAYPRALTLATADQVKAAQRFREWLAAQDSCVSLIAKGHRLYELSVDAEAYRRAFPDDAALPDLDQATLRQFEELAR